MRMLFRSSFDTTKKIRYPNTPPKVFSMRSSISADLPVKYCVNSMAKENSARERAVFQKLRILRNSTGIIRPNGMNITTFAAVWAIFFGSGIPQVS